MSKKFETKALAVMLALAIAIIALMALPKGFSRAQKKVLKFPSDNIVMETVTWAEGTTVNLKIDCPQGEFSSFALFTSDFKNHVYGEQLAKFFKQYSGEIVEQSEDLKVIKVKQKYYKQAGLDYFVIDKLGALSVQTENERKSAKKTPTLFTFGQKFFNNPTALKSFRSKSLVEVKKDKLKHSLLISNLKADLIIVFYDGDGRALKIAKEVVLATKERTEARNTFGVSSAPSVPTSIIESPVTLASGASSASSVSALTNPIFGSFSSKSTDSVSSQRSYSSSSTAPPTLKPNSSPPPPGTTSSTDKKAQSFIIKFKASDSSSNQYEGVKKRLSRWNITEDRIKPVFEKFGRKISLSNLKDSLKSTKEQIKLSPNAQNRATRSARTNYDNVPELGTIHEVSLTKAEDITEFLNDFKADPDVVYVQPNYAYSVTQVPSVQANDPLAPQQWALSNIHINVGGAWLYSEGEAVVVAVVDTGLRIEHEDLSNNVYTASGEIPNNCIDDDRNGFVDDVHGYDFTGIYTSNFGDPDAISPNYFPCTDRGNFHGVRDGNGHGTHVAGIVAAQRNNSLGVVGIAPRSKILAVKGLTDDGWGTTLSLSNALLYAAQNGADVINNSWGDGRGWDPLLTDSILAAYNLGAVVVFSNGNDSQEIPSGSWLNQGATINVASTDVSDNLSDFSTRGIRTSIAAPGGDILSTMSRDAGEPWWAGLDYARLSGTSMAAPFVSAVAALMLSANPTLSNYEVQSILQKTAFDRGSLGVDAEYGAGLVDANSAVQAAIAHISSPKKWPYVHLTSPLNKAWFSINPSTQQIAFNALLRGPAPDQVQYELHAKPLSQPNAAWFRISSGTSFPANGTIGTLNPASLQPDRYLAQVTLWTKGTKEITSDAIEFTVDYRGVMEVDKSYELPNLSLSGTKLIWSKLDWTSWIPDTLFTIYDLVSNSKVTKRIKLPSAISSIVLADRSFIYQTATFGFNWLVRPASIEKGLHLYNLDTDQDVTIEDCPPDLGFCYTTALTGWKNHATWQRYTSPNDTFTVEYRYFDGTTVGTVYTPPENAILGDHSLVGGYFFIIERLDGRERLLKIDPTTQHKQVLLDLPSVSGMGLCSMKLGLSASAEKHLAIKESICKEDEDSMQLHDHYNMHVYDPATDSLRKLFEAQYIRSFHITDSFLYYEGLDNFVYNGPEWNQPIPRDSDLFNFKSFNLNTHEHKTLTLSGTKKYNLTGSDQFIAWSEYEPHNLAYTIRFKNQGLLTNQDIIPPVTTASGIDSFWHSDSVTFTLSAFDSASGVKETYYTIDADQPKLYTGPITVTSEGVHIVRYYSVDNAGNIETLQESWRNIQIDRTAPTLTVSINDDATSTNSLINTINFNIIDTSAMGEGSEWEHSLDGINWSAPRNLSDTYYTFTDRSPGIKTIYARVKDPAGYWSAPASDSIIFQTPDLAITTVSVDLPAVIDQNGTIQTLEGDTTLFAVTVENIGAFSIPNFWVSFRVDEYFDESILVSEPLAPGEKRKIYSNNGWSRGLGRYELTTEITTNIQDYEHNQVNNRRVTSINVAAGNPPVIVNPGNQRVYAGNFLWFKVLCSDPDANPVTISLDSEIKGALLNAYQEFLWTPKDFQVGTHIVRFTCKDQPLQGRPSTTSIDVEILVAPAKISPPASPSALNVSSNSGGLAPSAYQAILSWSDNSDNEDGFWHDISTSRTGPFNHVYKLYPNIKTSWQAGLRAGQMYYFRVCAFNSYGQSCSKVTGYLAPSSSPQPTAIPSLAPPQSTPVP